MAEPLAVVPALNTMILLCALLAFGASVSRSSWVVKAVSRTVLLALITLAWLSQPASKIQNLVSQLWGRDIKYHEAKPGCERNIVSIDIVGPLPIGIKGLQYICVAIDGLPKWVEFKAIQIFWLWLLLDSVWSKFFINIAAPSLSALITAPTLLPTSSRTFSRSLNLRFLYCSISPSK